MSLNPIRWVFGGNSQESEDDKMSWEERKKTKDEEAEIFNINPEKKILGMDLQRKDIKRDLERRKRDLRKLKSQIRTHWTKYKEFLERVRDESGIDELEAKTKAAEAKKAAKDKQQLFKLMYKEYSALKDAMRKDETIKVASGSRYFVSFSEMDRAALEDQVENYRSQLLEAENSVKDFNSQLSRADHDITLDFDDLEKDVSELEMDTSDMDEDFQIVVQGPEEELATQEWDPST